MLHVRCGDDILPKLKAAGLPGELMRWADPLCQGPTPRGLTPSAWRRTRARFAVGHYGVTLKEAYAFLDDQNKKLEQYRTHEEIVLWFEHDLFDQVILVYLLDWWSRRPRARQKISLICVGKFPGKKRFTGLGTLESKELAGLFPGRQVVTLEQFKLARRAWEAWTHPTPLALQALGRADTAALPFLKKAIRRHMEQFPSKKNGLSLSEQWALEAVVEGANEPQAIFEAVQAREERLWCGDAMFWWYLDELIDGREPLLRVLRGGWKHNGRVPSVKFRLTERGVRVMREEEDWLERNPIDRWLGGVHLKGSKVWRWDGVKKHVTR